MGGDVPEEELKQHIKWSYDLIKPKSRGKDEQPMDAVFR